MFTTLITTHDLAQNLKNPNWVILDCRFDLANPDQGEVDYILAHIPGAVYVHLNRDLSAPVLPGKTGRHPLPEPEQAASFFSRCGIGNEVQVVAYDAAGGASAAVRAWWMLRWLGHEAAAVLDGGWQKWLREQLPVSTGVETNPPRVFQWKLRPELVVGVHEVEAMAAQAQPGLFDSRAAERFRGENETIDPVAGHIPGAISLPYSENLNPDGTFKSPQELRDRFLTALGQTPVERAVFYCGSGVTAIHNILAVAYAGLGMPRLFAGSWSEWITDPRRPIAR